MSSEQFIRSHKNLQTQKNKKIKKKMYKKKKKKKRQENNVPTLNTT